MKRRFGISIPNRNDRVTSAPVCGPKGVGTPGKAYYATTYLVYFHLSCSVTSGGTLDDKDLIYGPKLQSGCTCAETEILACKRVLYHLHAAVSAARNPHSPTDGCVRNMASGNHACAMAYMPAIDKHRRKVLSPRAACPPVHPGVKMHSTSCGVSADRLGPREPFRVRVGRPPDPQATVTLTGRGTPLARPQDSDPDQARTQHMMATVVQPPWP